MAMKLFPLYLILWTDVLHLWVSQSDASSRDVCEMYDFPGEPIVSFSSQWSVEETDLFDNFSCLLYSSNILNCSWSLDTLHKDAQLSVHISVCNDATAVEDMSSSIDTRVGSSSFTLQENEIPDLTVALEVNITLYGNLTTHGYLYTMKMMELLLPPQNISATIKDGNLVVSWDQPYSRLRTKGTCFEYQLDMGDEEGPRELQGNLSYMQLNADPSQTYHVRIRTKISNFCQSKTQWSEWSHVVTVEQPLYKLNTLVIISISLGIPMILLAVLLLVRHQRVAEVLFPPIPHPPSKYIHYLEKNDTFNPVHHFPSAEEEITEVEYLEPNSAKTF